MALLVIRLVSALASLYLVPTKIVRCWHLSSLVMPFLIVKALVPVQYSRVHLESVRGAVFRFLLGLVTYYLSLDIQSSYTVS